MTTKAETQIADPGVEQDVNDMPTFTEGTLDAGIPEGPIEKIWENHQFEMKLVNPANKRKFTVIVVGTGLAGGAAAASMAELGYDVKSFCYQDSARRGFHRRL